MPTRVASTKVTDNKGLREDVEKLEPRKASWWECEMGSCSFIVGIPNK